MSTSSWGREAGRLLPKDCNNGQGFQLSLAAACNKEEKKSKRAVIIAKGSSIKFLVKVDVVCNSSAVPRATRLRHGMEAIADAELLRVAPSFFQSANPCDPNQALSEPT
ncbi:hypothetical protein KSP39_PZI018573 [Platanthera zijinensis]|uniref:Uncharacterized protein n=1 Tax=Platanthera zijinensis TaxID=2320716 RepID=A0AAP0B416_9ASPA